MRGEWAALASTMRWLRTRRQQAHCSEPAIGTDATQADETLLGMVETDAGFDRRVARKFLPAEQRPPRNGADRVGSAQRGWVIPRFPVSAKLSAMLSQLRRRCAKPTWLWAALLSLTFFWQPVLSMLGELHATTHGDVVGHVVHADHAEIPAAPGAPGDNGLLHGLMHATVCCAHVSALPSSVALTVAIRPDTLVPLSAERHFESVLPARMLRPPITA